ncbi:MAG: hypothetical protein HRT45_18910 [Bdellovibrionales bacterium]|nr:hypothetical protein [Bdellovibrionales bacterium]
MESIDQIGSVPEAELVFFLLLNYVFILSREDYMYYKDDFAPAKYQFKIELLKKIFSHIAKIDEPLAMVLFESLKHTEAAAEGDYELYSDNPNYDAFWLRCRVFSHLSSIFDDKHESYLQHHVYLNWPEEPVLGSLKPEVKTRTAKSETPGSNSPLFSDLILEDEDCKGWGLHHLGGVFLYKLWRHGASDQVLMAMHAEHQKVDDYKHFEFFEKFGKIGLSAPVREHFQKLIDERLQAEQFFPDEAYGLSILTFASENYEDFKKNCKIIGLNAIEILSSDETPLKSALRAALRMDADVLLCDEATEFDQETVEILRSAFLTGHSLAFVDNCKQQIEQIKASLLEFQTEPKMFHLPFNR